VLFTDILPPWKMYFDGAVRRDGIGTGLAFVSPKKHILLYSFMLSQLYSNNVAKYQALNMSLQIAMRRDQRPQHIR